MIEGGLRSELMARMTLDQGASVEAAMEKSTLYYTPYRDGRIDLWEKPMTEQEWLTSADPAAMLRMLRFRREYPDSGLGLPPASERKLRLFDDACLEHFDANWPALRGSKMQVESWSKVATLLRDIFGNPWKHYEWSSDARDKASGNGDDSSGSFRHTEGMGEGGGTERYGHVILDSSILTPTVLFIAQAIYAQRAFDRMPVLADALEEAGCKDKRILDHCRNEEPCLRCGGSGHDVVRYPGGSYLAKCMRCGKVGPSEKGSGFEPATQHVRGCHVVDLILGKE